MPGEEGEAMMFETWRGGFWFRVSGWGLQGLHRSHEPVFSERYGYMKFFPRWPSVWRFRILRPERPR